MLRLYAICDGVGYVRSSKTRRGFLATLWQYFFRISDTSGVMCGKLGNFLKTVGNKGKAAISGGFQFVKMRGIDPVRSCHGNVENMQFLNVDCVFCPHFAHISPDHRQVQAFSCPTFHRQILLVVAKQQQEARVLAE